MKKSKNRKFTMILKQEDCKCLDKIKMSLSEKTYSKTLLRVINSWQDNVKELNEMTNKNIKLNNTISEYQESMRSLREGLEFLFDGKKKNILANRL